MHSRLVTLSLPILAFATPFSCRWGEVVVVEGLKLRVNVRTSPGTKKSGRYREVSVVEEVAISVGSTVFQFIF